MYAIIDIETTGLSRSGARITEVAVFKHDGKKIVDEFSSLVNPEVVIPYEITRLTGITNGMVRSAPKFYEIAKDILRVTEDCTFVAHNVNFDYGFIQREFKELGYSFKRKKLCTKRQSQVLMPGHRSYGLGNLCRDLGIIINGRHRAAGDARATVKLFEMLYNIDPELGTKVSDKEQLSKYLHPDLDVDKVLDLPKSTGVYYLYNADKEVIYVGKSTNLRTRLFNHLRQPKTEKAIKMHQEVADLSYEVTGSELIALLLESREIKSLQPKFNVAQRRPTYAFGIVQYMDLFGYLNLRATRVNSDQKPIARYATLKDAQRHLEHLVKDFELCLGMAGLQKCHRGCVTHGVGDCQGAALCEESAESYNERAEFAIANLEYFDKDLLIVDKGPEKGQIHAILIEDGAYRGYGLFEEHQDLTPELMKDGIKSYPDNPEVRGLIFQQLLKRPYRILNFES